MNTETITVGEIRAVDDKDASVGIISGYASVFNVIDSYKSVIKKGAFIETLKNRQGKIKFCYNHENGDSDRPLTILGRVSNINEDEHGLFVEMQFNLDVEKARDVFSLVKHGDLNTFSIGFTVKLNGQFHKNGIRHITDVELYEISVVGFEANEKAVISGVRKNIMTEQNDDERAISFVETIQDIEIGRRLYGGLTSALEETLWDIRWDITGEGASQNFDALIEHTDDALRDFIKMYMDTVREWVRRRQSAPPEETSSAFALEEKGSVALSLSQLAQKSGGGINQLALNTSLSLNEIRKLRQGELIPGVEKRLKEISPDLYDVYRKYRGQKLELVFSELRNGLLPAEKQRILSLLGFQFEAEQSAIDAEDHETDDLSQIASEFTKRSAELRTTIEGGITTCPAPKRV